MRLNFTRQPLRLCAVILPPALFCGSPQISATSNNRTFISATAREFLRLTAQSSIVTARADFFAINRLPTAVIQPLLLTAIAR